MHPKPRWYRRLFKVTPWVLSSIALALVITVLLNFPSGKMIAEWKQPPDITYDQRGPYYLSVVERNIDWFRLPPERNYLIYVGREAGGLGYGHMLKFSFHSFPDSTEEFVKKSQVEWSPEGVTLTTGTGHRVFIPKKMFIGGR